ncbi:MAG: hypothetical protein WBQ85_06150 [Candidatus Sulfotelmatobacter sp.]
MSVTALEVTAYLGLGVPKLMWMIALLIEELMLLSIVWRNIANSKAKR